MHRIADTFQEASELAVRAREEGAVACSDGYAVDVNPYDLFDDFYRRSAWQRGWAAQARVQAVKLVRAA